MGHERGAESGAFLLAQFSPQRSRLRLLTFLPRRSGWRLRMIFDKRLRALISAGLFCLAAALGGGARAAEVYPGCAQPGPTGKVWWVDPLNGKTPADGGNGSKTAPWNSLQGVLYFKFPAGYARPLLSSVPYFHLVDGKRAYVADQLGSPPIQP